MTTLTDWVKKYKQDCLDRKIRIDLIDPQALAELAFTAGFAAASSEFSIRLSEGCSPKEVSVSLSAEVLLSLINSKPPSLDASQEPPKVNKPENN